MGIALNRLREIEKRRAHSEKLPHNGSALEGLRQYLENLPASGTPVPPAVPPSVPLVGHHGVHVVELNRDVLQEWNFHAANPDRDPAKPCVYVGLTGLTPEKRFENHEAGYKSSKLVKKYGVRLLPHLYYNLNPMPYDEAARTEVELAEELREEGYAVWSP